MGIPVKLEVFEGPLDLLLHLIDKNKIDIYDIPIVLITDQYMEYIREMNTKDMNVMSEFLLMAATLLDIKCKMLLPKEVLDDEEEEDPREALIAQLLEYKMYKCMAVELKDLEQGGQYTFYKTPTIPDEVRQYQEPIDLDELLDGVTTVLLDKIFQQVIRRNYDKVDPVRSKFGKIEREEVNLDDKLTYLMSRVNLQHKISFHTLLMEQESKMHVVVTFLAVLELMKLGKIVIEQAELFDDIYIYSAA